MKREKKQENKIYEYAEKLMRQLELEWQRTGETTNLQRVGLNDITDINAAIVSMVMKNREQAEQTEYVDFEEGLSTLKESHVLLRLAKKIREHRMMADRRNERWFYVGLDNEEYAIFQKITSEDDTGELIYEEEV